ncbi:alpha/beta fold hydrolase [Lewinella sp. 4G2]|uniref:alpha/beta fold hydrolase n=1 Tax=Lewinella sp. 4G2 TaxID=1803372 RepID=UPI0007B4A1D2|nr:alpha/beta hydrolase [Lewinella sp. 4G2]OAV45704.1 sigma factor sigB regulation protein rsbQ [Lewinella sp. 4G2]
MSLIPLHNVTVTGSGERTLLMSHGFGCGQEMFRHLVTAFADDYRVVRYDLAGSGAYPAEQFSRSRYQSLQGYADDAIAICEELGLEDVIHIGHSVSAMIAGLAAAKRPDLFSEVVMICPSARYINEGEYVGGFSEQDIEELLEVMGENYVAWSGQLAPAIMGNAERPQLGEELTTSFCKMDPDIANFFGRVTFTSDNRADLKRITTPTLVLQCNEDIISPEPATRYVHEQLANSQLVSLKARGHCPNLSAPKETAQAIRNFLSQASVPA